MNADAGTRFLDITRLAARLGRGPLTGIDRVERAYLAALAGRPDPFYLTCRTVFGHLILGREAASAVLAWASGRPLPSAGPLDRLRGAPSAEGELRRLALARVRPGALAAWIGRQAPGGGVWLNVGHLALSERLVGDLGRVASLSRVAMIHDTIPLDFPELSADGAPDRFRGQLRAALGVDLILTPAQVVADDVARWAARLGLTPPETLVAPLGVAPAPPDAAALRSFDPVQPYFVALGTIEPRKDHALLLDIWDRFHATLSDDAIPRLIIAGRRGWRNEAVFARLDGAPFKNRTVYECPGLTDGAVTALLLGSAGLLAPSRAEGFGLPVAEAAALGVPVIAADLAVTREVVGNYPIYAPAGDLYSWAENITTLARQAASGQRRVARAEVPDWGAHFNLVFGRV